MRERRMSRPSNQTSPPFRATIVFVVAVVAFIALLFAARSEAATIDVCLEDWQRFMQRPSIDLSKVHVPEGHFIPVRYGCCDVVKPYFPPPKPTPPPEVPLPAAAWLFASALAGLGIVGRRKKRVDT